MNNYRISGMALSSLMLSSLIIACGTLPLFSTATPYPTYTPFPTYTPLPPTATPDQPTTTSVPEYPLTISIRPDAVLRFEGGQLELFDIYCERATSVEFEQAEVLLELDAEGKKTTIRGLVAISECSGWIAATDWANTDVLNLLFTLMGFKGEGYVRIAFYKAYPAEESPPSPQPESERLSVWLSIPAEFK